MHVRCKYLNPNIILVTAEGEETRHLKPKVSIMHVRCLYHNPYIILVTAEGEETGASQTKG